MTDFDLIKEFGLEKLSDEKKAALQEKILGLVDARYNRAIFGRMSEKEKKELDPLLDGDDFEAVAAFIAEKVPDFRENHAQIVEDLKKEMLGMRDAVFKKLQGSTSRLSFLGPRHCGAAMSTPFRTSGVRISWSQPASVPSSRETASLGNGIDDSDEYYGAGVDSSVKEILPRAGGERRSVVGMVAR